MEEFITWKHDTQPEFMGSSLTKYVILFEFLRNVVITHSRLYCLVVYTNKRLFYEPRISTLVHMQATDGRAQVNEKIYCAAI